MDTLPEDIQKIIFTIANNTCKKDGCNKEKRKSFYPLCPECHIGWRSYKFGDNQQNFSWSNKDKNRQYDWVQKSKISFLEQT